MIDPTKGDLVEEIMRLTNGSGVDGAIEALAHPATFQNCIKVTRAGGTISNIGFHGEAGNSLQIPLS